MKGQQKPWSSNKGHDTDDTIYNHNPHWRFYGPFKRFKTGFTRQEKGSDTAVWDVIILVGRWTLSIQFSCLE